MWHFLVVVFSASKEAFMLSEDLPKHPTGPAIPGAGAMPHFWITQSCKFEMLNQNELTSGRESVELDIKKHQGLKISFKHHCLLFWGSQRSSKSNRETECFPDNHV